MSTDHLVKIKVVDPQGNQIISPNGKYPVMDTKIGLLYNADAAVMAWAQNKIGAPPMTLMPVAIGVLREGCGTDTIDPFKDLVAAATFFNHRNRDGTSDVYVSVVSMDEFSARPEAIKGVLLYAFGDLKCRRISAEIDATNGRSIRSAQKLGFQIEGVKRRAGFESGDIITLGLLPDECPLLGGKHPDEMAIAA